MVKKEWFGWAGTILKVDLTKRKVSKQLLTEELAKGFLGGAGINAKILYDEITPGIDPLSPENILCFGVGPLGGTLAPSSGRYEVTTKSPMTGIFGDANSGGHWGAELHIAGYDNIVIRGRADKPVYLWIDDDNVELRDAHGIWGKNTWETEKILKAEIGDPTIRVSSIGQAGENLVRYACVICDLSRAAGRCGTGAVMGSKKLKAIAVRGTKGVKIAKPEEFEKACKELTEALLTHPLYNNMHRFGTLVLIKKCEDAGEMAYRNFQLATWPEWIKECSGEAIFKKYITKHKGCFNCPGSCSHYYWITKGPYAGTYGEGPEYENVAAFGAVLGNINLESILKCNTLADQYGLDVISTGRAIATAMHLYQEDVITREDTGGLDLSWGNHESIVSLVKRIARREGFGDLLAEGAWKLAKKIGKGAPRLVIQVKGMGGTTSDIRSNYRFCLRMCVASRGMDHMKGTNAPYPTPREVKEILGITIEELPPSYRADALKRPVSEALDPRGNAFYIFWSENRQAMLDSTGLCKYEGIYINPQRLKHFRDLIAAATGWNLTIADLYKCGERIYNIEKAFNVREGLTRQDDYPPARFFTEPITSGPAKGAVIEKKKYDEILDEYYKFRGWDIKTGVPTRKKLEELGLKYVADELERLGKLPQS